MSAAIDAAALATLCVSFEPDVDVLRRQFAALPEGCFRLVVDNGSAPAAVRALQELINGTPRAALLCNADNRGLAAAINQGVAEIRRAWPRLTHVLLLDQDSEPVADCVERLLRAWALLDDGRLRLGAVGPQLFDADTGLSHGFHQMTRWRWRRAYPAASDATPVPLANINGSGTLIRIDTFAALGGLDESLFIDHVDTEWSFRLLAAGYALRGVPHAQMLHRMGRRGLRWWLLRWRVWPARAPARHRFLFRNTVWLMRRPYVPVVWKVWAAAKLALTAALHGLFDPARGAQLAAMWCGLREGLRTREGA